MAAQNSSNVIDVSAVDSTPLDIDDLFDVQSELNPISSCWKSVGLALRLKHDVLETIQAGNPGNPTACLTVTLKEWLNQNYNVKKFGEPTWQHLVEAVNHPVGGANVALATKIARNHKAKVPATSELVVTQQTSPGSQKVTETQKSPPSSLSKLSDHSSPPQRTLPPAVVHGVTPHQAHSVPQMSELTLAEQTGPQGRAETQMTGSRSPLCTVSNLSPPPPTQTPVVLGETSLPYLHSVPQMSVMQTQQTQPQGGTEAQMGPPSSLSKVPDHSSPPQHTLQPAVAHGVSHHQAHSDLALARPSMATVGYSSSPIGLPSSLSKLSDHSSPPQHTLQPAVVHGVTPHQARSDLALTRLPVATVGYSSSPIATSGHQEVFARENQQAIIGKFANFQTNVCRKLLESGINIEEFQLFVASQFPPGDCIPSSPASLTEVFKAITNHGLWDYFHFSPLVQIAKKFGGNDPEMESLIQTYRKDLKAYMLIATLENYIEVNSDVTDPPAAKRAKYDLRYYTPVEWKTEFIDHSLQYLAEVWEVFSCHYLIPDCPPTCVLDRVRKGCFSVTWLVPTGLIPQLIKRTKNDTTFYQQHRILRVTVRDECIYEEENTLDPEQLFQACEQGDLEVVHRFLAAGIDVDIRDARGRTPLYLSSRKGQPDVVTKLLERGADVNHRKKNGVTPLWTASFHGYSTVVALLLNAGASPDIQNKDCASPLYVTAQEGHIDVCRLLIEQGANINSQTKDGWSPLGIASQEGHIDVCRLLIKHGAHINSQAKNGQTSLFNASMKGYDEVVTLLLKSEADVNLPDKDGFASLHVACHEGHPQVVELLLQAGASMEQETEDNQTPLYIACKEGRNQIVELLLRRKAEVNHQKKDGWSPLMTASEHGNYEIARLLIGRGANLNCQNKDQDTALTIASYHGKIEVVKELLAAGALTDIQDNDGRTALALASWNGHLSVVKELVVKEANPNIQDQEGLTALILAIKQGHTEIVWELVDHAKAEVNIQEQSTGWTALFFAAKDGDLDLTRLLIKDGALVELKDKNDVTALDVARTFSHESVCQELQSHMGRQHKQQKTTTEMKELVLSARKFLQSMFTRVERNILKTRALKREMTGNKSYSAHEGPKTAHIRSDK